MRSVRKKQGLSQEAFARSIGISRSAYQGYERAERVVPAAVIRSISERCEIDIRLLAFHDGGERVLRSNQQDGTRFALILSCIEQHTNALGDEERLDLAMKINSELFEDSQFGCPAPLTKETASEAVRRHLPYS